MYRFASSLHHAAPLLNTPAKLLVYGLEWFEQHVLCCRFEFPCEIAQMLSYHFGMEDLQRGIDDGSIVLRPATLEELDAFYDSLDEGYDEDDDEASYIA